MAYVPPHKRTGDGVSSPTAAMLAPRFRKNNLHVRPRWNNERSRWITYADNAITGWFAVGLDDKEAESSHPVFLQRVLMEAVERNNGEKPLALMRSSHVSDCPKTPNISAKPWNDIAEKIMQGLMCASESVRGLLEAEGPKPDDGIKAKLVARVGRVLFSPRQPSLYEHKWEQDSVGEASLKQLKRKFCTNLPSLYMNHIVDEVVPKIGFEFGDVKELYLVKLSDKCRPEATISCKCRLEKEENKLELYKIEYGLTRHMVYDISCIKKNQDLRLMLYTKRYLTSLADDEEESIRTLIASAILDPNTKGGLRWPLGKMSSVEGRFRVLETWHTISRVYTNHSARLVVRNADRFNFMTAFGETSGEVKLMLKRVKSELLGAKEVDATSMSQMLEDILQLLCENLLLSKEIVM